MGLTGDTKEFLMMGTNSLVLVSRDEVLEEDSDGMISWAAADKN